MRPARGEDVAHVPRERQPRAPVAVVAGQRPDEVPVPLFLGERGRGVGALRPDGRVVRGERVQQVVEGGMPLPLDGPETPQEPALGEAEVHPLELLELGPAPERVEVGILVEDPVAPGGHRPAVPPRDRLLQLGDGGAGDVVDLRVRVLAVEQDRQHARHVVVLVPRPQMPPSRLHDLVDPPLEHLDPGGPALREQVVQVGLEHRLVEGEDHRRGGAPDQCPVARVRPVQAQGLQQDRAGKDQLERAVRQDAAQRAQRRGAEPNLRPFGEEVLGLPDAQAREEDRGVVAQALRVATGGRCVAEEHRDVSAQGAGVRVPDPLVP